MNKPSSFDKNLPLYFKNFQTNIQGDIESTSSTLGNVLFSIAALIPSDGIDKNVWNLILTGSLESSPNENASTSRYHIVYDFSSIPEYKEKVSFDNDTIISGTIEICGKVLDATKIIGKNYFFSKDNLTLTITLDTAKWGFRLKPSAFSVINYSLNIGT